LLPCFFIFNIMRTIRRLIREIILEYHGGLGTSQSIGIGKNYHTLDPDPITWENYPGLEYDLNQEPGGKVYAKVKVTDHPEMDTPVRTFTDEDTAMFWIRREYETLRQKLMSNE